MKKEVVEKKVQTARNIVNVKDIKSDLLYTKDGNLMGYLRLYPINIDLMSDTEKKTLCNTLTAEFKAEKTGFSITCIPRTVDMEEYLNFLSMKQEEEIESLERRKLLAVMIREASNKIMSGENFEHQYYIKLWIPNNEGNDRKLKERLISFESYYQAIQNECRQVNDVEIIKLCNLYCNSSSAVFETYEDIDYTPLSFIRGKEK